MFLVVDKMSNRQKDKLTSHLSLLMASDLNKLVCFLSLELSRISIGESKRDNTGDSDSHYLLALATLGVAT
jgi:hypothetical protein